MRGHSGTCPETVKGTDRDSSLKGCPDVPCPAQPTATGRVITTESYKRLPLTAILEPDAFALQWAHAVRDRFPNAKPLWGESSVGEVGTDPNLYAVPWRLWWEGLV